MTDLPTNVTVPCRKCRRPVWTQESAPGTTPLAICAACRANHPVHECILPVIDARKTQEMAQSAAWHVKGYGNGDWRLRLTEETVSTPINYCPWCGGKLV